MNSKISCLISSAIAFLLNTAISLPVLSQVTPDGTTSTTVTPTDAGVQIDNGNRSGNNLFHSFNEFSVPTNTEAFFNNASDIANIFSRVTGGNISNIDGVIRANGTANLFLINPAGIVFGANARLQLGGSFYGSTADSIIFPDGEFSATDLDNPPLITVNAPIGLGFRDNPGEIVNQSTADNLGLQATEETTLALVGGNIRFTGGAIDAPGANVELGGLTAAGIVTINEDGSLGFSDELAKADVILDGEAVVNVTSDGGGSISVNASNLELLNGSDLLAGIVEGTSSLEAQAGDIIINATEKVILDSQESDLFTFIGNSAGGFSDLFTRGSPGNISIKTKVLEGNGNFTIGSVNNGEGSVGNVEIIATESVSLVGREDFSSGLSSIVGFSGTGAGGDVIVTTPALTISEAIIITSTLGQGGAGNIELNVTESLTINRGSQLQAASFSGGDAGDISIDGATANLTFTGEDIIISTSVGALESLFPENPEIVDLLETLGFSPVTGSQGGDILITANNLDANNDVLISTSTVGKASPESLANAGNIEINITENLNLSGISTINSDTFGQGNAGDVSLVVGDRLTVSGDSRISTGVQQKVGSLGEDFERSLQGGNINITSRIASLSDGGQISAGTFDFGNGGNINLDIQDTLNIDGVSQNGFFSGVFGTVQANAVGNGGEIIITTTDIAISNGGTINASTFGEGNAGSISIAARGNIAIDGTSPDSNFVSGIGSAVNPNAVGNGGVIEINTNNLSLTGGGQINTSTFGEGNTGRISVIAKDRIIIDGVAPDGDSFSGFFSAIAPGATGNSNQLEISADNISLSNRGVISISSLGRGSGGSLDLIANNLSLANASILALNQPSQPLNTDESRIGGNINLDIDETISLQDNSLISAQAGENASGGNINIDTELIIAFPSSFDGNDIRADAELGQGGNITIQAESVIGIAETETLSPLTNDINASSQVGGLEGTISIDTPDINPLRATTELPNNPIANNIVATNACNVPTATENSNLVVKGKGGVIPNAIDPLKADSLIIGDRDDEINSLTTKPVPDSFKSEIFSDLPYKIKPTIKTEATGELYAARGMLRQADGTVYLTAYPISDDKRIASLTSRNCNR